MRKRWLKLASMTLGLAVALVAAALVLVQTPVAGRIIIGQARRYLLQKHKIDLQSSGARIHLLSRAVTLENVVVGSASAEGLPPIFKASRIYVRLGILNTLRGMPDLEELRIDSPQVSYHIDKDGRDNVPKLQSADSGGSGDFLIADARLEPGAFHYQDARNDSAVVVPEWRLSIKGDRNTLSHQVQFEVPRVNRIAFAGRDYPVGHVTIAGTLQRNDILIQFGQIGLPNSRIDVTGSITDLSDPDMHLLVKPDLDMNELSRIAGSTVPVSGRLSGSIALGGRARDLSISAQIAGRTVSAGTYRNTKFDLAVRAKVSDGITIQSFRLNSPEGSVDATGQLFAESLNKTSRIDGRIGNLDLSRLLKNFDLPLDIASRLSARISVNWKDAFALPKLSGTALVDLTTTRALPAPDTLPLSGTVDARLASDRITGTLRKIAAMGATMDGTFTLGSLKTIEADVKGTVPELDLLMRELSRFLGEEKESVAGIRIAGPASFNAQVKGELSNPLIDVSAEAPTLKAADLKDVGLTTHATIQNNSIAFQNRIALPQNSSISADGTLETGEKKPVLTLDARTNGTPVSAILEMFESTIPASGTVSSEVHLSGPVDALAGKMLLKGSDLFLEKEPLGEIDIALSLSDNEIRTEKFRVTGDPSRPDTDYLDAQFTYNLKTTEYTLASSGRDLTLAHRLSRLKDLHADLDFTATGSGTTAEPFIDADFRSNDVRLKDRSLGPLSVSVKLRKQDLTIEGSAPRLNLTSSAYLKNEKPFPFHGEVELEGPDLALFGIEIEKDRQLGGTINADLNFSGNIENLAGMVASAIIRTLQIRSGDIEISNESPVHARLQGKTVELAEPAVLVSGDSRVEISGRVPLEESGASGILALKGEIDLAQAAAFLPDRKKVSPSGTLKADLSLSGTPKNLTGAGTVTLENGSVQFEQVATPVTNIGIRAEIKDGALVLREAGAHFGEATLSATGVLPFGLLPKDLPVQFARAHGPASYTLDIRNFKPESFGTLPEGISGLVSMHSEGRASTLDLRSLESTIAFPVLSLKADQIEIHQREPAVFTVKNGVASIESFSLVGTETSISASGSAGLLPDGQIELGIIGDFDAALLTLVDENLKAAGKAQIRIVVGGTRSTPKFAGFAEMNDGRVMLKSPRLVADGLGIRLSLTPEEVSIQEFKGTLNGGSLKVEGAAGYNGSLQNVNFKATLQDIFLEYPEGLKSSSSGNLTVTSQDDSFVIGGTIRIQESSYREDFTVTGQLMNFLKSQEFIEETEPNPLLDRIRLNVAVRTSTPLLVNNNIAKLEGTANLRLVGTVNEPSMTGRITLEEGGEIILNERTFFVNRGNITLTDQTQIRPELDIQAQTKVGDHVIILEMSGTADKLTTTLQDEAQVLTEREILSLLLTGRTETAQASDTPMGTMQNQAISLLAGQAGEQLTREARQALRLSTLRIDPGLIDSDGEPRLILGEDITTKLSLLYATSLESTAAQEITTRYDFSQRLNLQATKQRDNSFRFQMLHDLRLGGQARRRTTSRERNAKFQIGSIDLGGIEGPSAQTVLQKFGAKEGKKYDFPKIQKSLDKLQDYYISQKRLEADIRLNRETVGNKVDLKLNVNPGPLVEFVYEGIVLPESVRKKVEEVWADGVFDIERLDDAELTIRRYLLDQGYLQADISHNVATGDDRKTVLFVVEPGVRYTNVALTFPGASRISEWALNEAIEKAGLSYEIHTDPRKPAEFLKRYYQQRGYLQAQVSLPQLILDAEKGTGKIAIAIREGPQFLVGELEFSGNSSFQYDELWSIIPTSSGSIFKPASMQDAVKAIENFYRSKGYNEVSVGYRTSQHPETAQADVTFQISERRQSIIREIVIEGNQRTSSELVRAQLDFQTGDVLNISKIDEARRRFYSTRVYNSADFVMEDLPDSPGSKTKNVRVRVRLREVRPYRVQYGVLYDTERNFGGLLEAQNLNFLGKASNVGLKVRYDFNLFETKLFFNQPFVNKIHLKMDAIAFYQDEERESFHATRKGFSLLRQKEFPGKFTLDYGYRFDYVKWDEKATTDGKQGFTPDPTIFQAEDPVSRLIVTINRDTRDSVLDATRGEFTSHSFEYGPEWMGSHTGFARYYGQYFKYVPLEKYLGLRTKDAEGKSLPSSFVYAAALRLGLTAPFKRTDSKGSPIISPERFFAGGGSTMRGFPQDLLGPKEQIVVGDNKTIDSPTGGEALFLFNNEIRFPLFGIFQGVLFLDIGNVYPRLSDFNFAFRKTAGAGLRAKIKFIPLRFDYGWKIDRLRPEDRSAGEFFFSIGQAF